MSDLLNSVVRSISTRSLLRPGQPVLVAVSGGVDSMVLLDVLKGLSGKYAWRLTVAHLNHRLRGRASDADERLVKRVAGKLKLPFVSEEVDVKALAQRERLSTEMAARKARHEFLAGTAIRLKIPTVALAHHGDDQLELLFLRLLRGSGSDGLAGMKWRAASPADRRIELIRPLLDQTKSSLLEYAEQRKIPFREDATNASAEFERNRIRHQLLPLLRKKFLLRSEASMLRSMEILAAEAEFLNDTAHDWLRARTRIVFEKLPVALQRRVLQVQLFELGVEATFDRIEALRLDSGRSFMVGSGFWLERDSAGRVSVRKAVPDVSLHPDETVKLVGRSGELRFGELRIHWKIDDCGLAGKPKPSPGREVFDGDKVGSEIVLRHWRPGDRFQPIGMSQEVKLQDLFVNQKIRREERHQLVVAVAENGKLFWVEKLRISEQFKVSEQTIRRLLWQWKPR